MYKRSCVFLFFFFKLLSLTCESDEFPYDAARKLALKKEFCYFFLHQHNPISGDRIYMGKNYSVVVSLLCL